LIFNFRCWGAIADALKSGPGQRKTGLARTGFMSGPVTGRDFGRALLQNYLPKNLAANLQDIAGQSSYQ
jgi:hypothetical protein